MTWGRRPVDFGSACLVAAMAQAYQRATSGPHSRDIRGASVHGNVSLRGDCRTRPNAHMEEACDAPHALLCLCGKMCDGAHLQASSVATIRQARASKGGLGSAWGLLPRRPECGGGGATSHQGRSGADLSSIRGRSRAHEGLIRGRLELDLGSVRGRNSVELRWIWGRSVVGVGSVAGQSVADLWSV